MAYLEHGRRPLNALLDRISIDPNICGGKPCIKGTRLWVSLLLDLLASGTSEAELRSEYPQLSHDDVLAAIAYGAETSRERIVPVPVSGAGRRKLDENLGQSAAGFCAFGLTHQPAFKALRARQMTC
jgi:uncharacterized protein (DUF433 family)